MGLLDSAFDSIEGMLADQWKDIITAGPFDEHALVAPGVRKRQQNDFGANLGSEDVLSNGSVIFVPENTAAFIFSQAGIEQVLTEPGGHEYRNGEATVFDRQDRSEHGMGRILLDQVGERFGFSGMASEEKRVAYLNLREIRGLRFGTRGPLVYNDQYYGTDLELYAYGSFTVRVIDPMQVVRDFVPANMSSYSLDDPQARKQLLAEFLHSFTVAANALSESYRISQLPMHADDIASYIGADIANAGTWPARFGLELVAVAIENIELSEQSRELVRQFSEKKMSVRAYEGVSQRAADVAAQQMIAQGVRDNGLGEGGAMLFGMNLAAGLDPRTAASASGGGTAAVSNASETGAGAAHPTGAAGASTSLDDQIEALQKLKGLLDAGILSQDEFDAKKREILGL